MKLSLLWRNMTPISIQELFGALLISLQTVRPKISISPISTCTLVQINYNTTNLLITTYFAQNLLLFTLLLFKQHVHVLHEKINFSMMYKPQLFKWWHLKSGDMRSQNLQLYHKISIHKQLSIITNLLNV